MIAIKQTLYVNKLNLRDIERNITDNIRVITGWNKSACEIGLIKLGKGLSMLIVRNIKLKKYKFITVGASNKDITVINKDLSEERCHFEYILEVSGKSLNNKTVAAIVKDFEAGDVCEAIKLFNAIGRCAADKHNTIIDKMAFAVKTSEHQETPTIILTKEWENTKAESLEDISFNIDSFARPGKMKFIQLIACTNRESKFILNMDNMDLAAMVCIAMFIDGRTEFEEFSTDCFNFAKILPVNKLSDKDIKSLKLKTDKDDLPIIDEPEQFDKMLEILYK